MVERPRDYFRSLLLFGWPLSVVFVIVGGSGGIVYRIAAGLVTGAIFGVVVIIPLAVFRRWRARRRLPCVHAGGGQVRAVVWRIGSRPETSIESPARSGPGPHDRAILWQSRYRRDTRAVWRRSPRSAGGPERGPSPRQSQGVLGGELRPRLLGRMADPREHGRQDLCRYLKSLCPPSSS